MLKDYNQRIMNLKTIFAAGLLLISTAAFAQEDTNPHWYAGVQGGVQAQPLDGELGDLLTPHFGAQVGRQITDVFGMRLQALGYQAKGMFNEAAITGVPGTVKDYNVWSAKWDVLFNVTNIIAPNRTNKSFNWNMFMGAGATGAWNAPRYSNKFALYPGLGTQVEYMLAKNIGLNLEVQANKKALTLNEIEHGNHWQGVALLGLTYHFPAKKKVIPVVEPVFAERVDTIWYDDTEYRTKVVTEEFTCDDHFQICQSQPVSESVVTKVVDFVKTYKNVSVSVTGYADKGTGNPRVNQKYSQQRAEAVAEALKTAGVPETIMTVDWKGDTVQPFEENDDNRAAIVKVSGETEQKYPVTVKKYRTEVVRYQVQ